MIELPGEELIISSGYIAECKSFSASGSLLPHIINAIKNKNSKLKKITTIAGKIRYKYYKDRYKIFVNNLVSQFSGQIIINPIYFNNWHAKVSIKISGRKPIAAIIGSSNLTSTAYGLMGKWNWNRECDVVIWDNDCKECSIIFRELIDIKDQDIIYFKSIDKGPSEKERLKEFYDEIKELHQINKNLSDFR